MDRVRDGFVDFMRFRGYAERTVEAYAAAAGKAVRFCGGKPPRRIEEHEIRAWLLHLKAEKIARGTFSIALGGARQLFAGSLERDWKVFQVASPTYVKKLPVVLSRDEVHRILGAVAIPVYRVCLATISACGLRLMEGTWLRATRTLPRFSPCEVAATLLGPCRHEARPAPRPRRPQPRSTPRRGSGAIPHAGFPI